MSFRTIYYYRMAINEMALWCTVYIIIYLQSGRLQGERIRCGIIFELMGDSLALFIPLWTWKLKTENAVIDSNNGSRMTSYSLWMAKPEQYEGRMDSLLKLQKTTLRVFGEIITGHWIINTREILVLDIRSMTLALKVYLEELDRNLIDWGNYCITI